MVAAARDPGAVDVGSFLHQRPVLSGAQETLLADRMGLLRDIMGDRRASDWSVVHAGKGIEVARMKDPTGFHIDIFRMKAVQQIPVARLLEMWRNPEYRPQWDEQCLSAEIVRELAPDDRIMRVVLKPMFLMAPREQFFRVVTQRDFPAAGTITVVLVPHDPGPGTPPPKGMVRSYPRFLNSIMRPDPKDPKRTETTMFAQFDLGGVPGFIGNTLIGTILPRMPAKLDAGYRKLFPGDA